VVAHGQRELGEPARWARSDPWETGFVDLAGGQGLLGQVDGRTTAAVRGWLEQRTPQSAPACRWW
jgi:hypothetical protein